MFRNKMIIRSGIAMFVLAAIAAMAAYLGGEFDLSWNTIDGGGGMESTGGDFKLSATIGQPDAGVMTGGDFKLTGGFWPGAAPDSDGDGVGDAVDNCPDDANADQLDSDGPDPALSPVAAWHFDENTGATATDEVAGHVGTLNTVGWNPSGYRGSALDFPSGGSTVSVSASTDFDITDNLTIALWVNPDGFPVNSNRLVTRPSENYVFRLQGQKPHFYVKKGGDLTGARASIIINAGEWTHLAAVWDGLDGGLLRIYVNGLEVPAYDSQGAVDAPLDTFGTGLSLGNVGSERFEGLMDELVIYDHALSDAEVLKLFNFGIGDGAGDACDNCPTIANFNDDCANALLIGEGTTEFCNEDATDDGPPDCQPGSMSRDIWFRYIATDTGTLIVDTCAELDFDTIMAVYTGTCGALTLEGCDDDGCPLGLQSRIADIPVTAGQELLIRVGAFAPDRGAGVLTVEFCQDGEFTLDDYRDFEACLLGPGADLGIDCVCFDFDNDGDVTLEDFGGLQVDFGD